jgi:hypothetical protein
VYITQSYLNKLVGGGGSSSGGSSGGSGIGTGDDADRGSMSSSLSGMGGSSATGSASSGLGPAWTPLGSLTSAPAGTPGNPPRDAKERRYRYEFVVMFVWREPVTPLEKKN